MRFCYNCHRITIGDPLFCNFCGRSYEIKLCPRLHVNPRAAQVCSLCGSRELSTPHPQVPFWTRPFFLLLSKLPGVLLWLFTVVFFFAFVHTLITNQELLGKFMFLGLILALVWYLYMQLPDFVRRAIQRRIRKSDHQSGHTRR